MKFFLVILLVPLLALISCGREENNISNIISEVEQKETELKDVGTPQFLIEEQKGLETNTNQQTVVKDVDEFFETKTLKTTKLNTTNTNIQEQKLEPSEEDKAFLVSENRYDIKKENTTDPKATTQKPKTKQVKTNKRGVKVFFSYRNGKNYIDTRNPGKITTVVYVSRNIWYIDYSVYAIPYDKLNNYKKYLSSRYLIGIGRNISVVDLRSQLTVYWRGRNINKKTLPNGKYSIVVKTSYKNKSKKVISTSTKILGGSKPLVVILAN
ncbi:MAG: hypothetical protein RMJ37_03885 [Spirochaetia bacterium]|nr:hypothetical protein [Spirochaetota bacterium]MDW8112468.1 hypothetical protein [Spirochaetia bacterium]